MMSGFAGLGVDLDLAHCAAERIRGDRIGVVVLARERCQVEESDAAVGAFHREPAARELDVGCRRLEFLGGEPPAFLDDLLARSVDHHRAHPHRAARVRSAADRRNVGIARQQAHRAHVDAEPFGDELREARLVPLAGRDRAKDHIHAAVLADIDLCTLARRARIELDVVAHADAAQQPA
jgi:hypothetical protein